MSESHENTRKFGPILFFSGGTALKEVAVELAQRDEPSVHIVTTFDSGGSSAVLRCVFGMPAVGDLRNRILALSPENPLLAYRLATTMPDAVTEFLAIATGYHPLWQTQPPALRRRLLALFGLLTTNMTRDFDFRGASVGNLVFTALWQREGSSLTRACYDFSRLTQLTQARGVVRPVAETSAHLAAQLADGRELVGQHRFASKHDPLGFGSPLVSIRLCNEHGAALRVPLAAAARRLIGQAGLICYPVGSFFSSVCASLLPEGVAEAVAAARCPKVYLPNPGFDPELEGVPFAAQLAYLQHLLPKNSLTHVLVDAGAVPSDCPPTLLTTDSLLAERNEQNERGRLDPARTIDALCRIRSQACTL